MPMHQSIPLRKGLQFI